MDLPGGSLSRLSLKAFFLLPLLFGFASPSQSQPAAPVLTEGPRGATVSSPPRWSWSAPSGSIMQYAFWPNWEPAPIYLSPQQRTFEASGFLKPGFYWINVAAIDPQGRWSPWSSDGFTLQAPPSLFSRPTGQIDFGDGKPCTGVLIDEDLFLTAAHCVLNCSSGDACVCSGAKPVSAMKVTFENIVNRQGESTDWRTYRVAKIVRQRCSFQASPTQGITELSDWALLRLERKAVDGTATAPGFRFGSASLAQLPSGSDLDIAHHAAMGPQRLLATKGSIVDGTPQLLTLEDHRLPLSTRNCSVTDAEVAQLPRGTCYAADCTPSRTLPLTGLCLEGGASGAAVRDASDRLVGVVQSAARTTSVKKIASEDSGVRSLTEGAIEGWVRNPDGFCLAPVGASTANDTQLILADCKFLASSNVSFSWRLQGKSLTFQGKCATQRGAFFDRGTPIILFDCHDGGHQKYVRYGGALKTEYAGRCLAPKDGVVANGTPVVLEDCVPNDPKQQWSFVWKEEITQP